MRHSAYAVPEPRPFGTMNITPLIDVMLVLLIIFILAIPAATHKVPVDLPGRGSPAAELERHRMVIGASGAVTIDGAAMPDAALPARLAAIAARNNTVLELETAPEARYERFDALLATIRTAGITRLGFVGNERHARF
jgi:biopolymer transport protein ExbD